ncbi:MAG: Mov34/MPN/PAD-1 family protein [Acidimicrobiia bacterium]
MSLASPTLRLTESQHRQILAHCYDGLPDEACGLLGGPIDDHDEPTGALSAVYPCTNAEASARTYTVDSRDLIKAMRDAESRGDHLVGVFHSHTHTVAYPSPTDVAQAMEPGWIYVIVSLKDGDPALRAYRIRAGEIAEVAVALERSITSS